jgi:hypothetical protein
MEDFLPLSSPCQDLLSFATRQRPRNDLERVDIYHGLMFANLGVEVWRRMLLSLENDPHSVDDGDRRHCSKPEPGGLPSGEIP